MSKVQWVMRSWGSRIAVAGFAAFVGFAMVAEEVEARRMGGGKSFGRQSQNVQRQQAQPPARDSAGQQAAQPGQGQAAQPQAGRNRWMGPLAGLAAGLGIAALLSAFGLTGPFAEMLGSLLLIALLAFAVMFVWRMLRGSRGQTPAQRRLEPAFEAPVPDAGVARYQSSTAARPGSVAATLGAASAPLASAAANAAPWGVPADFDVEGFLRIAKVHFIRLQAAWDARNLDDIREFTTPEVFAEIRMQLSENAAATHTEVASLEAQLLGIEEGATDYVASVRFDGSIREEKEAAEPVSEVWNLSKPKQGNRGWLLAGIQQLQ